MKEKLITRQKQKKYEKIKEAKVFSAPKILEIDKIEIPKKVNIAIFLLRESPKLIIPSLYAFQIIEEGNEIEAIILNVKRKFTKIIPPPIKEFYEILYYPVIEHERVCVSPYMKINPPIIRLEKIPLFSKTDFSFAIRAVPHYLSKKETKNINKQKSEEVFPTDNISYAPEPSEIIDFFESLFGNEAGKIFQGKPVCIIVPKTKEKYEEMLAIVCRDAYRERKGGKPIPIYRKNVNELKIEFEPRVENEVVVVEDTEIDNEYLFEVIKGFFSLDIGFLILVTNEPHQLRKKISKNIPSANIVEIHPTADIKLKRDRILTLVRGRHLLTQQLSFGEEFKTSVEEFDKELIEKYLNYRKAPPELKKEWDKLEACSIESGEASKEHSAMKAFVWIYEWKLHNKEKIPYIEYESNNKIIDIKIDDKNYEIETLFGVGDAMNKLTKKIKNYALGEKIYFVLRNIDILRNLSLLWSFRSHWRKQGYKIDFLGIDLENKKFLSLNDIVNLLFSRNGG